MALSEKDFSLREKKYAKTKITLANAFIERMKTSKFSDISIKEICESAEVSEGTFFNYFPQKIDVVFYYQQMVSLKISWQIRQYWETKSFKELIELIFDLIAEQIEQPYLFYEIISLFTSERKRPEGMALTPAEKFFAHPDYAGIDEVPVQHLEEIFLTLVTEAVGKAEFKTDIKPADVVLTLMAILIGVPLAIHIEDFGGLKQYYRSQLSLLWKAIGVK